MKKIICLVLMIAMLFSVSAFAETQVSHSLVPFAEVYWGDTRDQLIERLGIAFPGSDEGSLISSTDIGGLTYSVVYNFDGGVISGVTVFTDAVGKEEYRETCAVLYDVMVDSVITAYGETAVAEHSDVWNDETAKARYESADWSIPMWDGALTRKCIIATEYATAQSMFVLTGNTLNIGYVVLPTEEDTGIWIQKAFVDEFDMPTDDYFIVNGSAIIGKFSNSATSGSELKVYIFCQEYSDLAEDFIKIRMFEYGSYRVNNSYSKSKYYNVTMMDAAGNKYYLEGYIPSKSEDIRVVDKDAQTIIRALKAGGTIRFAIASTEYSQDKYSFVIENASGFDTIYQQWKAQ